MADEVVMHDFIGERVLDMDARPNTNIDSLLEEIVILKLLAPLIERGLITFDLPYLPVCAHCLNKLQETTTQIVDQMYSQFRRQMKVGKYSDGKRFIETGPLYDPPVYLRGFSTFKGTQDDLIWHAIERCVGPTMFDLATAAGIGGTVFSNSAIAMAATLASEGRFNGPSGLRTLNVQRAGMLPWVKGLSIPQTLELRDEAKTALPQLREFLANNLGATEALETGRASTETDYIVQLREQAEEVRSELNIVTSRSRRLTQSSLGIAFLGISAVGLLTDAMNLPTAGLGLLGILASIRGSDGPHEEHVARQKSRPGYVLIAAKDILQHASG